MQAEYQAGEGQLDESAKTLTVALSRSPKAWQLWQALAMVQERRKDAAETKKAIEQFEKYAPDRDTVVSFEARQAVEAGHFDEARQILEKAAPSLSAAGKIAARDQLIEIDLRQGRRQEARRRLEEAAAEAPADLQILETLGQTAADDRDWKAVEDIENRLKKAEGDDGTLWRELRVRRQLAQIVESDDPRFREAERTTREIAATAAELAAPLGFAGPFGPPHESARRGHRRVPTGDPFGQSKHRSLRGVDRSAQRATSLHRGRPRI